VRPAAANYYCGVDTPRRVTRRATYRRRRVVVFGSLGVVLIAFVYIVSSLVAPLPATAAVAEKTITMSEPAAQLDWPGFGASAVTVLGYPGISESNGTAKSLPIASITKTITALVVLSAKPIAPGASGPSITFTQKDVGILDQVQAEDGSWAPVVAGSVLTEKQALEAMLLPSANNYAISLADWAFGSVPAYVSAANAWVAKHQLSGTHIEAPDGLDPGNVSTTGDLVSIAKMVSADPTLSTIVDLKQATVPGAGQLTNTNSLLGKDGVDGIKTGNTDQAGFCLMFSSKLTIGGTKLTVLGVVLGANTHAELWSSVQTLLNSVKSGFHQVDLTTPGQSFGSYTTAWGAKAKLVATDTRSMLVWSNSPVSLVIQARPLAIGNAGDVVGQVTFQHGSTTITAPLALASKLKDPGFAWRLAHPAGLGA
jgi:serine-type D-Ala-D-Ala carboxypeptidase (penicillin-binding protein 5/6)